jgi:hypothetical protein
MDIESTKQFLEGQSFKRRLLMTYILKCNKTGKQRLWFAIWSLVCHYINAVFFLMFLIVTWAQAFIELVLNQEISGDAYVITGLTLSRLIDIITLPLLAILPASLILISPFLLLSKKKIEKHPNN